MATIQRLPADLCNQIAAGEVVERPASVVKELVENSIDAGATRVQIDVGAGGIGVLRVTDDGSGMDETDLRLALERHATSKIARFDDLLTLRTFGFRGEALPSIASVSRLTLRSRQRGSDEGAEVICEGGGPLQVAACGMAPGTIVEVRDLFYNVPARRKFLKSASAESAAITSMVDALALTSHELTITLTRDGRTVKQWLRAPSRARRVMDARSDDRLAPIAAQRGPLRVEAFLGPPELARSGAVGLTLLVNGRVVRDRILARIIAQAYGSVLESGRYPVGVVYIDIDAELVDVNVHPQKAEVRFADGRAVQDAVYAVVSEGLAGAFGIAPPSRAFGPRPAPPPSIIGGAPAVPAALPLRPFPTNRTTEPSRPDSCDPDPWGLAPPMPPPAPAVQPALPLSVAGRPADPVATCAQPADLSYSALRFVAQLRNTYLICEGPDGIVILDQHAAAERVTFAKLRASYRDRAVASQRLLLPVTVSIDAIEAAFLEEHQDDVSALGMELRAIGPSTAMVTAVPQIVSRAAPDRLARDLLDEVRRAGGRGFSGQVDLVLATMACHGSVRAGDTMTADEVAALLDALDHVDHAGHCPHGRPLLMQIRFAELERQVGRR